MSLPVDCTLGKDCFIQQYVDRDPGPGAADFTCGPLSYDGHNGTDFALPSFDAMERGVHVLATADGVVGGLRDGEPDLGSRGMTPGKECGNGLVLDHGDGWVTQYCHMKKGSFLVAPGQKVSRGKALGEIGFSGRSEFPHLHLSLRRNGAVVDPFAPTSTAGCETAGHSQKGLWREKVKYTPGDLISIGFADRVPDYSEIKQGNAALSELSPDLPALVIFGYAFGVRSGDVMHLRITGPDGIVADQLVTLEKTQAQVFRAVGKRRTTARWPSGDYKAEVTIRRAATIIAAQNLVMTIE